MSFCKLSEDLNCHFEEKVFLFQPSRRRGESKDRDLTLRDLQGQLMPLLPARRGQMALILLVQPGHLMSI